MVPDEGAVVGEHDNGHHIEAHHGLAEEMVLDVGEGDALVLLALGPGDRLAGQPLSALRRVFTSTNTSASSLTAMISASPAKQVQLRSRMV